MYTLPFNERRRLHDRAYRAQQRDHSEVCGLVVVEAGARLRLVFLANRSARPGHYEIRRRDIVVASRDARQDGAKVLGTFHSHPISEATPSKGDIARGFLLRHELIYDVCGCDVRLWRLGRRRATDPPREVAIVVQPRPRRPGERRLVGQSAMHGRAQSDGRKLQRKKHYAR